MIESTSIKRTDALIVKRLDTELLIVPSQTLEITKRKRTDVLTAKRWDTGLRNVLYQSRIRKSKKNAIIVKNWDTNLKIVQSLKLKENRRRKPPKKKVLGEPRRAGAGDK